MESDFSAGAGVRKIIAGTNVTISPAGGTGNVTVNASGGSVSPATSVVGPDAFNTPAVVGTSTLYARQDHDHGLPSAPVVPAGSGTVTGPDAFGASAAAGSASTYSKGDHNHGLPANPSPAAATTVVGPDAYGSPAVVGSSGSFARADHDHGLPAASGGVNPATTVTGPDAFNSPAVVGTSVLYARQDHDHGLPSNTGGSANSRPYDYEVTFAGSTYTATPISPKYSTTYTSASLTTLVSDLMGIVSGSMAIYIDSSVNYSGTVTLSASQVMFEGPGLQNRTSGPYIEDVEITGSQVIAGGYRCAQTALVASSSTINFVWLHDIAFTSNSTYTGLVINNSTNGVEYCWFDRLTCFGNGTTTTGNITYLGKSSSNGHHEFRDIFMFSTVAGQIGFQGTAGMYQGPPVDVYNLDIYDGYGGFQPFQLQAMTASAQGFISLIFWKIRIECHITTHTILNIALSSFPVYLGIYVNILIILNDGTNQTTIINNLNTDWEAPGGASQGVLIYKILSQFGPAYAIGTTGASSTFTWTVDHA